VADPVPEPFGKLLIDARRARGMSLQEVSGSTKIPVSKLQAIERDDIGSLPGGIFTRGFVRSYAEAVGLNPQETLSKFEEKFPDESSVATLHATIEGRANEEFVRQQRAAKGVVWLGLLMLPLMVWLLSVLAPDDQGPATPAATVVEDIESPEEASAPAPEPRPASPTGPVSPPPGESEARSDPPQVAATGSAPLTMEIVPTADCWVLASADGDTVLSRVLGAGERQVIVARNGIDLRIGDAGAFAFAINQRPGRSLGGSGEVVNVSVTPSNYLSFVVE
jgi:cytoskeletal protein RodZ